MERLSVEQFRKLTKKGNKYHAIKTIYNGRTFDSRKEADFAKRLEWLRHAHEERDRVVRIEYQVPFDIKVKRTHVFRYIADFRITYGDGRQEVYDVKGSKSGAAYALFRLKKKCVEAQYGVEIKEI